MHCYAVLTAGGVGSRMNSDIPKQFIHVNNKPVIIHTLEKFQIHPSINGIVVACLSGWETVLETYARAFGVSKLMRIVTGGHTNQESIWNCLSSLSDIAKPEDYVVIHDGNRALVPQDVISNAIGVAVREGSSIASIPCTEVIARRDYDSATVSHETIRRECLARTQTPHVMRFSDIVMLHERAREDRIDSAALPELMVHYGMPINLTPGNSVNFKITTSDDLEMFRALVERREAE